MTDNPTAAVSETQGKLVVSLAGDIDLERSAAVRKLLLDCVERDRDVLVDLSAVDYIDSSGIANLIEAFQASKQRGTGFGLIAVSEQAMRVLELARLNKVFTIHAAVADAVAARS
ncbi:MAG: STAS domain-containing protein [Alphaproteobacteria bacterium]